MTSPEDDDLEEALRRALSEAANEVEPGSDGLDAIRARIAGRPPRPWLLSVLFGVAERVRNFTWRGHWAWPGWLSRLAEARWPHLRRGSFPRWGTGTLRLAAIVAAVAVVASLTLGVQPLRRAILQARTVLQGNSGPQRTTAGTEGNGATALGSGGPSAADAATVGNGTGSTLGPVSASDGAKTRPSSAAKCQPNVLPAATSTQLSLTGALPSASATSTATPAASAQATTRTPGHTDTSALTCPVTSPTKTPTPTPTATSTVPAPAPTGTSATPVSDDPGTWSPPATTEPPTTDPTTDPPVTSPPTTRRVWPGSFGPPSRASAPDRSPRGFQHVPDRRR